MNRCKFVKQDGLQCNAYATTGSSYCFSHNPDYKKEKALAVKKGGLAPKKFLLNNQEEVVIESAKDAMLFLSKVINGVWKGEIPATPVANTLGFLVRCYLDAYDKSEIEGRLDEIERAIEEKKI